MTSLHNEEICAMRNTASLLRKRIALEADQSIKQRLKRDVDELESLIMKRLGETSDYADIKMEEDVY